MENRSYLELTILLPCLNESETLATCIEKAKRYLEKSGLSGEVLVADNGSTDGSQEIAISNGARLVNVSTKGYGAALKNGIESVRSKWIVMGDSDDSYDLENLDKFVKELEKGSDLVIGNRFKGGILPGAMPWLHYYIGNPILSYLGRKFFRISIRDFHCGLRAFQTESIRNLGLESKGMEFASEMIVKASIKNLRITEVPTILKPDGRSRKPHLNTWRDGFRHLTFLLMLSPKYLFFYPGFFLICISIFGLGLLLNGPSTFLKFNLDLNAFLFLIGLMLIGSQIIFFSLIATTFLFTKGLLTKSKFAKNFESIFSLEKGVALGFFFLAFSAIGASKILNHWNGETLIGIDFGDSIRISGLMVLSASLGLQLIFTSFIVKMLQNNK